MKEKIAIYTIYCAFSDFFQDFQQKKKCKPHLLCDEIFYSIPLVNNDCV
jgi:hypothetical protein